MTRADNSINSVKDLQALLPVAELEARRFIRDHAPMYDARENQLPSPSPNLAEQVMGEFVERYYKNQTQIGVYGKYDVQLITEMIKYILFTEFHRYG